ncbi:Uncharacterised protein [Mycolicibacterium flavescens]|uniref:DUF3987 domain-containing protein n=1 Tax=Mycobacterium neumannii TaxID=2048551 RepID=UPI000B943A0E|nr:DUF3987 domain-containing protein [Mycobacterium neumannii]VEG39413.1 Uncharacterised protein [Mycolicibacterium flavescens]
MTDRIGRALAIAERLNAEFRDERNGHEQAIPPPGAGPNDSRHASNDDARDVWPVLDDTALYGNAGAIVDLLAPHTEADKPALPVHLLASFGAAAGHSPHILVGGKWHPPLLHGLVVGRTSDGAKGTAWDIVRAVLLRALPDFADNIMSGLTSGEGVIELVRDASGDDPEAKDFDPGVSDKRLLIIEEEYRSVLSRSHVEGSRLATVLRDAWDGNTLASLARKRNKMVATDPHITLIGHITPGELRDSLRDSDLSGGSINRLVVVLSRRSQLHPRLGNVPDDEMATAAAILAAAHTFADKVGTLSFTERFWRRWDHVYPELRASRPDTWASKSVARGPAQVLRISMLHALFNETDVIDADHLDAAMALWRYAEARVLWIFDQPASEDTGPAALEQFILEAGKRGCSRTDISVKHFHRNKTSAQIDAELQPLLDAGRVAERRIDTSGRARTTYVHASLNERNENTKNAGNSHV